MKKQNNEMQSSQDRYVFSCVSMVKKDDKIWFSAREINGLFSMELDGKKLEYRGSFSNELESQTYLHGKSLVYNEKILFVPYNARSIDVYDVSKNEFEKLQFEEEYYFSNYLSAVLYKSYLILLPAEKSNSVIVKIDLNKKTVKYIENWQYAFILDSQTEELFREYCIVDNTMYAPIVSAKGQIMEYNLETDEISCVRIGGKQKYKAICYDGNDFYLCAQKGNILVRWNRESGQIKQYIINEQEDIAIMSCVYRNEHVILFTINQADSGLQDMVISVDTVNGKVEKFFQASRKREIDNLLCMSFGSIFAVIEEENKLYAFNGGNGKLYEIDMILMQRKEYEIEGTNIREIYREKFLNRKSSIYTENKVTLQEFPLLLKAEGDKNDGKKQISFGSKIWQKLKE